MIGHRVAVFARIVPSRCQRFQKLALHADTACCMKEMTEVIATRSRGECRFPVCPPVSILENVLTLRVHLDDCRSDNGPLRVLPGSHRHGWIEDNLDDWKSNVQEVCCEADAGSVVAMRPLLLHASSASESPGHRRVLHIEYAADKLPGGLQWHTRIRA